jgi:hypothetical protein
MPHRVATLYLQYSQDKQAKCFFIILFVVSEMVVELLFLDVWFLLTRSAKLVCHLLAIGSVR